MPIEPRRNLYGRHVGRALRPAQAAVLDRVLASHGFQNGTPSDIQKIYRQSWIEIGFGAGEHLAWQAGCNPETILFGAEYFLNGVARACKYIDDAQLSNVRLYHGDGRDMMDLLPDQSIHRAFILHPDPWPKARQWRRRIVSAQTLDRLADLLVPGAVLRIASDHSDYQPWILRVLLAHPAFKWTANRAHDWTIRPADWPQTRYEVKSIREGRPTMYIEAVRR